MASSDQKDTSSESGKRTTNLTVFTSDGRRHSLLGESTVGSTADPHARPDTHSTHTHHKPPTIPSTFATSFLHHRGDSGTPYTANPTSAESQSESALPTSETWTTLPKEMMHPSLMMEMEGGEETASSSGTRSDCFASGSFQSVTLTRSSPLLSGREHAGMGGVHGGVHKEPLPSLSALNLTGSGSVGSYGSAPMLARNTFPPVRPHSMTTLTNPSRPPLPSLIIASSSSQHQNHHPHHQRPPHPLSTGAHMYPLCTVSTTHSPITVSPVCLPTAQPHSAPASLPTRDVQAVRSPPVFSMMEEGTLLHRQAGHVHPSFQPSSRSQTDMTSTNTSNLTNTATPKLRLKYPCPICGKRFQSRAHLRRHDVSHTGEKPFVCLYEGCEKRFSRYDNMLQHYRTFNHQRAMQQQHIQMQAQRVVVESVLQLQQQQQQQQAQQPQQGQEQVRERSPGLVMREQQQNQQQVSRPPPKQ